MKARAPPCAPGWAGARGAAAMGAGLLGSTLAAEMAGGRRGALATVSVLAREKAFRCEGAVHSPLEGPGRGRTRFGGGPAPAGVALGGLGFAPSRLAAMQLCVPSSLSVSFAVSRAPGVPFASSPQVSAPPLHSLPSLASLCWWCRTLRSSCEPPAGSCGAGIPPTKLAIAEEEGAPVGGGPCPNLEARDDRPDTSTC